MNGLAKISFKRVFETLKNIWWSIVCCGIVSTNDIYEKEANLRRLSVAETSRQGSPIVGRVLSRNFNSDVGVACHIKHVSFHSTTDTPSPVRKLNQVAPVHILSSSRFCKEAASSETSSASPQFRYTNKIGPQKKTRRVRKKKKPKRKKVRVV